MTVSIFIICSNFLGARAVYPLANLPRAKLARLHNRGAGDDDEEGDPTSLSSLKDFKVERDRGARAKGCWWFPAAVMRCRRGREADRTLREREKWLMRTMDVRMTRKNVVVIGRREREGGGDGGLERGRLQWRVRMARDGQAGDADEQGSKDGFSLFNNSPVQTAVGMKFDVHFENL